MLKPTILNCSRTTAMIIIIISILLFILIGCQALFKSAGLTDEQAALQTAELKTALADAATEALANIQTGLAEGHDLKTIALKTSSSFIWKIIAAGGASIGVVLNGLLAKWLTTEKKMNKALITAIEADNSNSTKQNVHARAIDLGVEKKLHKRVVSLT